MAWRVFGAEGATEALECLLVPLPGPFQVAQASVGGVEEGGGA